MKKILQFALLLFPLSLAAQTITVGSTTTQLTSAQRVAVGGSGTGSYTYYWPDGDIGAIYHGGTNIIFAPVLNDSGAAGTVQTTLSNLNNWTSGLSLALPATNIAIGGSGAFDQNYAGGNAIYYDAASGYLIQLYHAEFWYNGSSQSEPFYSSHGLAYSTDFGVHWAKLGEVVSPQTVRNSACGNTEVGSGTLLVVGSYLYDYYTDTPTGCASLYLTVARAPIASVIAAAEAGTPFTSGAGTLFMKYTGGGTWTGNGVTDLANPQNGGGASTQITTVSSGGPLLEPNVRYNSYLNKYLLVYANNLGTNSIEAQWSTDGVTWTGTQTLISGANNAYYPSLLNTSGGGSDPQVLGQNFSLFYVSPLGYTGTNPESLYSTALSVSGGPTTFNLTVTATNGTITGTNCASGSYSSGTPIGPCTFTPSAGYTFTSGWSGTGSLSGVSGTGTASGTLTSNATLSASGTASGCGNYTSASCSQSDVNSAINGPDHIACNGDVITVHSGTCTWTTDVVVTASIDIVGQGATPNTGPSTFGAGTNGVTIKSNNGGGPIWFLEPTYNPTSNVTKLENMNLDPINGSTSLGGVVFIEGTATSAGFPQVRVDNIGFGISTPWTEGGNSANTVDMLRVDNVIGVADHNTLPTGSLSNHLMTGQMSTYLGVGLNGDNSWAQPDSFGGLTNWFNENNQTYINASTFNDCTEAGITVQQSGGCRVVNRFNHATGYQAFDFTAVHGLDSTGRERSGRHTETYANTFTCQFNCNDLGASFRGGTGLVFGNTGLNTGGSAFSYMMDFTTYRIALAPSQTVPWGECGGLSSIDPYDTVDNVVYVSGTLTSGGATSAGDTSKSWTSNQWITPTGSPYWFYDVTQAVGSQITSNTNNSLSMFALVNSGAVYAPGDAYEIIRATVCEDQAGRGQGAYVSGYYASPVAPMNEVLDPIYEWGNSAQSISQQVGNNYSGQILQNRDYYTDNWKTAGLSGPVAQTSTTVPFNGTTTCNAGSGNYSCGVGFGTLANRPATCTNGVGYWATDQGNWNQSGLACSPNQIGGGCQGVLYKCGPSGWPSSASYIPAQYPHPLIGGGGTLYTFSTATAGSGTGTVACTPTPGSYTPGTSVTCTATASAGSTFSSWSGLCTGSANPCTFSLTSNGVATATFGLSGQYYLSPTGNDANNGTSTGTPWLTPNHSLNCGDTITAAAGAYSGWNFWTGTWGTVTGSGHCFATLQCATAFACTINTTSGTGSFWVDHSHWWITGWAVTGSSASSDSGCFDAQPASSGTAAIFDIVFANNIANGCREGGFVSNTYGSYGVDYFAFVGNIAYNATQGNAECYSGIAINSPYAHDTTAGTHIYSAGNFSFGNLDPNPCNSTTPTDGEGQIVDTVNASSGGFNYGQQIVVDNEILVSNGGRGFSVVLNNNSSPYASIYARKLTMWQNNRDPNQSFSGQGELTLTNAFNVQAYTNLAQAAATTGGGQTEYAFSCANGNATDAVYNSFGTGVGGNNTFINSCPGFSFGPGNTLGTSPAFASPSAPGAPACGSYATTTACMATVIANFTPSASGASAYGYQQPSTTSVYDPLFPQWLCPYTSKFAGLVTPGCSSAPPVNYLLTVTASNGSVTGTNCGTNTYPTGTFIGPCTPVANPGYSFSGWSNISGSAVCTGTVVPCAQFALGAPSGFTANFVAIPIGSPIRLSGQLIAKGQVQMH